MQWFRSAICIRTWGGGSLKKGPELPRPRTFGRVDQKVTDNLIADSVAWTVDQLQNRPHAKHLGWKYITSYAENFETRLVRKLPRSSVQGPYHSYGVSSWVTPGQPVKRLVRVAPLAGYVQIRYFKSDFTIESMSRLTVLWRRPMRGQCFETNWLAMLNNFKLRG